MKESALKEKLSLIEKEVATLADRLDELDDIAEALKEIRAELKGLKLFLNRTYPEFKNQFPKIMEKLKD